MASLNEMKEQVILNRKVTLDASTLYETAKETEQIFGWKILSYLIEFVKNNRELYPQYFLLQNSPLKINIVNVSVNNKKECFRVAVKEWCGDENIYHALMVPFLMITDTAAYKKQRIADLKEKEDSKNKQYEISLQKSIKNKQAKLERLMKENNYG